jgi:hypothetical protein
MLLMDRIRPGPLLNAIHAFADFRTSCEDDGGNGLFVSLNQYFR